MNDYYDVKTILVTWKLLENIKFWTAVKFDTLWTELPERVVEYLKKVLCARVNCWILSWLGHFEGVQRINNQDF